MHGVHKEPDIEVATADQILPIVKSSMGIGFIAEFMAKEALAKGEIIELPLDDPLPSRSICLVEERNRSLSVAARKLKSYLHSAQ